METKMKLNDTQRMIIAISPIRIEGIDEKPFKMTKKDWIFLAIMCSVMFLPFLTLI